MDGLSPVSAPSGSSQPPAELGETVPEGGQHEAVQERVDGGRCLTEHGCKRTVRERDVSWRPAWDHVEVVVEEVRVSGDEGEEDRGVGRPGDDPDRQE